MWLFHLVSGEVAWHEPQNMQMQKLLVFVPKNDRTYYTKFWFSHETQCVQDCPMKAPLTF
jgi:hypothetical protein